jgi:hypothetical protein
MIADLVLETGLSERQLLTDCGPDVLEAMVELINERRTEGSGGHSRQARAMLERLGTSWG